MNARSVAFVLAGLLLACGQLWANTQAPDSVLLVQYLRFSLASQVVQQVEQLAGGQEAGRQGELRSYAKAWQSSCKARIRANLHKQFGPDGRSRFEGFVNELQRAEGTRDAAVLARFASSFAFSGEAPTTFAELRSRVLQEQLAEDVQEASALLARMQLWTESSSGRSLQDWMSEAGSAPEAQVKPVAVPRNALREAEAGAGDWQSPGEEDGGSPVAAFDQARQERRARALEEARAGMQQVAEERRAAEEEYGQKKMAEAQADADAVKRQSERLAATEQEALEQRQKSWGNRLKSIVGATISAATGAFTGGIGTRAGQEAANALFE